MATHSLIQGDCGGEWYSYEEGDIRQDRETLRLLVLRQRVHPLTNPEDQDYDAEWVVQDLVLDTLWTCDENDIARETYTEMQAIAYVAANPEIYCG